MAIKKKPAAKKSKMPAELLERFKSKAAKSKGKDKPTKVGASAKREERMAKKTAPPKRTKGTKHVGQERTAKGTPREGGDGKGPGRLTDAQKMKAAQGRAQAKKKAAEMAKNKKKSKPKAGKDKIVKVENKQPPKGSWNK